MKQQLKDAALKLFLEYGPKRITVDDIISALRISKNTFYDIFRNKDELVTEIFHDVLAKTTHQLATLSSKTDDDLTAFLLWHVYFYLHLKKFSPSCAYELNKYYEELGKDYQQFRKNVMLKNLFTLGKKAQSKGIIRTDVNLKIFIELQLKGLEEVLFATGNLISNHTQADRDSLAAHIIVNNIRGVISESFIPDFEESRIRVKRIYEAGE